MSWFKNAAAYLGLVEGSTAKVADEVYDDETTPNVTSLITPAPVAMASAAAAPTAAPARMVELARITTLSPLNYNGAKRIGEEFRNGVPVIMNVSDMDDDDAKRLVDFAAGLVFGLHGSIERITTKVFLLSPAHVEVGATARAQMRSDGFFNQS